MTNDAETYPIIVDGRLVALAAATRWYLLSHDLSDNQLRLAAAMCLCSREVRQGRLAGPFTPELAERWARTFLALGG